jgi:hypothetical protein
MLTIGFENLTEPGDELHYGDVVKLHLTGQKRGGPPWHLEVAAYGNRIDWPVPGTYADKGADRDASPTFTLGVSASGGAQNSAEWDDDGNYITAYYMTNKGGLPVATVPVLGRR